MYGLERGKPHLSIICHIYYIFLANGLGITQFLNLYKHFNNYHIKQLIFIGMVLKEPILYI